MEQNDIKYWQFNGKSTDGEEDKDRDKGEEGKDKGEEGKDKEKDVKKGKTKNKGESKDDGKMHTISGMNEYENFEFDVLRRKDKYTKREVLRITAYYCGDEYGTIISKVAKLDSDIFELRDIGISLMRPVLTELGAVIKYNFYELDLESCEGIENNIPDNLLTGIVTYFKGYIINNGIPVKDGLYNIPVEDFKNEISETEYNIYGLSAIKEALKGRGYTKCNVNRYDYAIKENKKNNRYISFYADKIDRV